MPDIFDVPSTITMYGFSFSLLVFVALGLFGTVVCMAVRSPMRWWQRSIVLLCAMCFVPVVVLAMLEQLSLPKPLEWAWYVESREALQVHSVKYDPPHNIYVWVLLPGDRLPRSYALQWTEGLEESIRELEGRTQKNGSRLMLRFESSRALEPQFYDMPWPKPPRKELFTPPPPVVYEDAV